MPATRFGHRAFDVVAFDLDGTLADTAADIATAANHMLSGSGLPGVGVPEVRSRIGGGLESLVRGLLPDHPAIPFDVAANRFREAYGRCFDQQTALYPGVAELLDELGHAGVQMAVATNKVEALARPLIEHLGISRYFFKLVGPESITRRKPDPETLTLILRASAAPASRTLMVGDHPADILCGKAAGTRTCAVTYGYGGRDDLAAVQPDFTVDVFPDLLRHIFPGREDEVRGSHWPGPVYTAATSR